MELRKAITYWKPIVASLVGGAIFIVTTTLSVTSWTNAQIQDQVQLSEAKQALAHDYYFQQSRISMKEVEIREHQRELKNLLEYIGDDEPTPREEREIEFLEEEIRTLRQDIENIKKDLADAHK